MGWLNSQKSSACAELGCFPSGQQLDQCLGESSPFVDFHSCDEAFPIEISPLGRMRFLPPNH